MNSFLFGNWFSRSPRKDYTKLIEAGAIVIDVRTPLEYSNKCFEGSINIPLDDLSIKIDSIVQNKDAVILVCCSSNEKTNTRRSKMASTFLRQSNYKNVHTVGDYRNLLEV